MTVKQGLRKGGFDVRTDECGLGSSGTSDVLTKFANVVLSVKFSQLQYVLPRFLYRFQSS